MNKPLISSFLPTQAQARLSESSRKLDLIRKSLELRTKELPQDSPAAKQLKRELANVQSSSPVPVQYTSLQPFRGNGEGRSALSQSSLSRCAAVSGKLEVRLMGCQDLLEDVPGRSRRDKDATSSPGDLGSFFKGVTSRSSSKSYSVKDETSLEIMAIIKLDNITVGQTSWKPCSQQAWDQRFSIDLDKSRELEIGIFWRDWRSLCAVKFLRLEEFIDDIRHGMALQLEPQGLLFAEIKFLNPMISRKPKLQRQRMIFNKQQMKNMPKANQMNINVATWGRLLKRNNAPSGGVAGSVGSGTQAGGGSTANSVDNANYGPQPTQLNFDQSLTENEDHVETPGENPDVTVIGLSGARPLGIQSITALPESPVLHHQHHQNVVNNNVIPPQPPARPAHLPLKTGQNNNNNVNLRQTPTTPPNAIRSPGTPPSIAHLQHKGDHEVSLRGRGNQNEQGRGSSFSRWQWREMINFKGLERNSIEG